MYPKYDINFIVCNVINNTVKASNIKEKNFA